MRTVVLISALLCAVVICADGDTEQDSERFNEISELQSRTIRATENVGNKEESALRYQLPNIQSHGERKDELTRVKRWGRRRRSRRRRSLWRRVKRVVRKAKRVVRKAKRVVRKAVKRVVRKSKRVFRKAVKRMRGIFKKKTTPSKSYPEPTYVYVYGETEKCPPNYSLLKTECVTENLAIREKSVANNHTYNCPNGYIRQKCTCIFVEEKYPDFKITRWKHVRACEAKDTPSKQHLPKYGTPYECSIHQKPMRNITQEDVDRCNAYGKTKRPRTVCHPSFVNPDNCDDMFCITMNHDQKLRNITLAQIEMCYGRATSTAQTCPVVFRQVHKPGHIETDEDYYCGCGHRTGASLFSCDDSYCSDDVPVYRRR